MTDTTMREQVQNGKDVLESLHRITASIEKSELRSMIHEHADHLLQVLQNMDKQLDKAPEDPDTIIDSIIGEAVNDMATSMESEERGAGPPVPTLPGIYGARQFIRRKSLAYTTKHYLPKAVIADFRQRFGVLRAQLIKAAKNTLEGVMAREAETATLCQILH